MAFHRSLIEATTDISVMKVMKGRNTAKPIEITGSWRGKQARIHGKTTPGTTDLAVLWSVLHPPSLSTVRDVRFRKLGWSSFHGLGSRGTLTRVSFDHGFTLPESGVALGDLVGRGLVEPGGTSESDDKGRKAQDHLEPVRAKQVHEDERHHGRHDRQSNCVSYIYRFWRLNTR